MDELWRPAPGWPNYEVSSLGRVRRLRWFTGKRIVEAVRMMALTPDAAGRVGVSMSDHLSGRKPSRVMVARLVLEAFVGPPSAGMEACHFPDRDPRNNRLDNLRWDLKGENEQDKIAHGTQRRLTKAQVRDVRDQLRSGASKASIAEKVGCHPSTVCRIATRQYYGWLVK